ncbi:MAG TPA: TonB-dependent receptor, partial [Longimicrobiaceae bacterium]|nr:TonB-dependent receptor [Longimicrobiaceae bacterium]
PRLFWDGGAGRSVFATVGYLAEERRGGTVDGARLPDGSEFREALGTRRVDGGLSGRFPTRGGLLLGVRAAAAETRRRRSFGEEGDRERTRTGLAEATLGGTAGLHAWLLGAAVQHDALSSAANPAAGYGRTVPGVFAQDEYAPAEWLRVAASVRADFDRGFGTRVSPRASLLLRPAEPFTVRLSAGAGYMPPTRLVEEVEAVGLQRLVPPGRLRAERARNGSVDVGWASARWQVTETLFAAEIRDAVLARPSLSAPGLLELVNAASPTRAWGSELLASFNAAPLHVIAAHTFTRSREADPERARRVESPLVPRHALSLDVLLESEARGRIGVETSYTGRQRLEDDPYRQWSRSYLLVGVLGELRFGETGVFLNAENLGGVRQTRWEPLLRPSAGPGGRWTTDAWAPLDGRKLNLGVRLEL